MNKISKLSLAKRARYTKKSKNAGPLVFLAAFAFLARNKFDSGSTGLGILNEKL